MPGIGAVLPALDILSALLGLTVSAYFLRVWRLSREPRYLLFAIGLALVGLAFVTVAPSSFGSSSRMEGWDQLRLVGQVGGALVVLMTYLASGRSESANVFVVLGAAVATICVLGAALVIVVPPAWALPDEDVTLTVGHAVMTLTWAAITVLSARNAWEHPRRDLLLVPGAFASFALSKYTWFILDLTGDARLAALVYPWRLLGLVLLLLALLPRKTAPEARLGAA